MPNPCPGCDYYLAPELSLCSYAGQAGQHLPEGCTMNKPQGWKKRARARARRKGNPMQNEHPVTTANRQAIARSRGSTYLVTGHPLDHPFTAPPVLPDDDDQRPWELLETHICQLVVELQPSPIRAGLDLTGPPEPQKAMLNVLMVLWTRDDNPPEDSAEQFDDALEEQAEGSDDG